MAAIPLRVVLPLPLGGTGLPLTKNGLPLLFYAGDGSELAVGAHGLVAAGVVATLGTEAFVVVLPSLMLFCISLCIH